MISQENLKLNKKQVSEVMTLLRREEEDALLERQREKEVKTGAAPGGDGGSPGGAGADKGAAKATQQH